MRVLVVNEPALVQALERLRGEWETRSHGSLSAEAISWEDVAKSQSLKGDLIIFPARYLGELGTRGWLRPVRRNVLEGEVFNAADVFPLARNELVTWGGHLLALPLGVNLPEAGFLAEVAPAIASQDRLGELFDPDTMKTRITEQPFVEAIARLKTANVAAGGVPVLGTGDRLVAVTTSSRNAASAFKLLEWLASGDISTQLAASVGGVLPVRRSQLSLPTWYDAKLDADQRAKLRERIEYSLDAEKYLIVPRIPGVDRYLAALDDAVAKATSGEADPAAALSDAAATWETITEELGRDAQRQAYAKHLGIAEE